MTRNTRAFCLVLLCASFVCAQDRIVQTSAGAIAGKPSKNSQVLSFKGVPFAAAPVGKLRWKPPVPVTPWKGIRDAGNFGASCMQRIHGDFLPWTAEFLTHNRVSEDCLYLNIWTPKAVAGANLPVIVFVHGGAFTEGAGDVPVYDGEHLASTGLVMVTINYRLGVFGFLALPELAAESDHHSAGNYGLLDQIAALRWVRENIRNFGGDPHRVTIWGQSAGAFSVGALIASPLAAGLFERAVADSGLGVAGMPMADLATAEKTGEAFSAQHHTRSLDQLRALPADRLLPADSGDALHFAPIVDGWVLPRSPAEANARGGDAGVPVITGYQANDGLLFLPRNPTHESFDQNAKRQYGDFAAEFEKLYPATSAADVKQALIESARDRDRVSMFLWASRRIKNHREPVFTYYFDRAIPWPAHPEFGAFHSGELPYFFGNLDMLDRPWEQIDRDLAKTVQAYLNTFAAKGDPNGDHLTVWRAVDPKAPSTMQLGSRIGPMPLASPARLDLWLRFFNSPQAEHAPLF